MELRKPLCPLEGKLALVRNLIFRLTHVIADPAKNPLAKKYARLSYRQCTDDSLRVMDETAITLCKENNIPVLVLNMLERGTIMRAVLGESVGTVVCEGCDDGEEAVLLA